jgi:hypothetical protein
MTETQERQASAIEYDWAFEALRPFIGEADARRFLKLQYRLQRSSSGLPNVGDDGFNIIELHGIDA